MVAVLFQVKGECRKMTLNAMWLLVGSWNGEMITLKDISETIYKFEYGL